MNDARPPISVVIRNRNEKAALARALRALRLQTISPEIIVVDNESSDGSIDEAQEHGARVIPISRAEFTYGRALNRGIAAARANVVLLLSAHCVPFGPQFLEACLAPFSDDTVVGASCLDRSYGSEWIREPTTFRGPMEWAAALQVPFSNACSVVRRSACLRFPFDESVEYAEDKLWFYQVLAAGQRIVSCRAIYSYERGRKWREGIRVYDRLQVSTFRFCGRVYPAVTLTEVAKAILVVAPKRAISTVVSSALHYLLTKTTPVRARFKPRSGSVR